MENTYQCSFIGSATHMVGVAFLLKDIWGLGSSGCLTVPIEHRIDMFGLLLGIGYSRRRAFINDYGIFQVSEILFVLV